MDRRTFSLIETTIKDRTDRTNTILKQIEKIRKDTKNTILKLELNISPNKISDILEFSKNLLKILKEINVRLIPKLHHFLKEVQIIK